MTSIPFSKLVQSLPELLSIMGDTEITAPVVESSTDVQPGGVFVAWRGLNVDGHDFITDAVARGAAAVVGERDLEDIGVPYARVASAQAATGHLAAAYYSYPSRRLVVIGVTGTDGKTTTSTLLHSILKQAYPGRVGLISTIAADLGSATVETGLHVTTPGAPQIQALLAQMLANGMTHVVLEMTSHGLAQGRLNGVDVDVAVLTNLTHEHLDYHGTFEAYRAAKARLFESLSTSARKPGQQKVSIVNGDDPNANYFGAFQADLRLRYGINRVVDFRAARVTHHAGLTRFDVRSPLLPGGAALFEMHLAGDFNISNALAAIAAARAMGVKVEQMQTGIRAVEAVSGRMQRLDAGQDFVALVDFAHTPNALRNALEAARGMTDKGGRVIAVFGSAGLRDRDKRRLMAEVATELADFSIITAEDPRTESLDDILATMAAAAVNVGGIEGETFVRVPDRGQALLRACQTARTGDVVIVCGKGHEQSMAFGKIEYPWDDREALKAALNGVALATLPTAVSE
jgi:UDP-N-acetylmuramoyl-L-alanyl-D-glutamate--2,6-diaminopimelate ligase